MYSYGRFRFRAGKYLRWVFGYGGSWQSVDLPWQISIRSLLVLYTCLPVMYLCSSTELLNLSVAPTAIISIYLFNLTGGHDFGYSAATIDKKCRSSTAKFEPLTVALFMFAVPGHLYLIVQWASVEPQCRTGRCICFEVYLSFDGRVRF